MTATVPDRTVAATDLAAAAAVTAAATLASGEPLAPGAVLTDAAAFEADGEAVIAPFTGPVSGELLLLVDEELTAALRSSELGPLDLGAALGPAVQAVGAALGPVTLGPVQVLDARIALQRVFGHDDAALVPLVGASGPRAGVAVGVDAPVAAVAHQPMPFEDVPAARLDLLRGVEMDATAELGRTRMTVNDLLSLRTGAVIELDRAAGAAADLYVNGRLIARGEVVVVDENYGLRITQVVADDAGR